MFKIVWQLHAYVLLWSCFSKFLLCPYLFIMRLLIAHEKSN